MLIGDQIGRCLDYQISHEDTEFFEEITDFIKGGCMLGNSYLVVYRKFTSDGTYLRPLLKTTDYFDVLPITGARRVTKARGVFVREFATYEELLKLQKQGIYRNVAELEGARMSGADPNVKWHEALLQEVGMSNYQVSDNDIGVIHYFSGGHVITFGNRKKRILSSVNGK